MPCYRCGARQTDPGRGQSPWRRGVRHDCQVLVCPECQAAHDWAGEFDQCPRCRSVHLVRRLGEVECRDCGTVVPPSGVADEQSHGGQAAGLSALSEEVARALERVLGRSAVHQ